MLEDPIVSVVIPTFNRRHVLDRAVQSVLRQSMPKFELIVVDDGSADETAAYLATLTDPRVKVISQANAGVCAARNVGVQQSSAGFVTFLDSDDEANDGWLDFYAAASLRGMNLATCAIHFVGPGSRYELVKPERLDASMGCLRARFMPGAFGLDKELLLEVGGFREGLRFSEHTDLAFRLGGRMLERPFSVLAVDDPYLTMHRDHRPYNPALRYEAAMTLLTEDEVHMRRNRRTHANYLAIAGVAAARLGDQRQSKRLLARAVRVNPLDGKNLLRLVRQLLSKGRPLHHESEAFVDDRRIVE